MQVSALNCTKPWAVVFAGMPDRSNGFSARDFRDLCVRAQMLSEWKHVTLSCINLAAVKLLSSVNKGCFWDAIFGTLSSSQSKWPQECHVSAQD